MDSHNKVVKCYLPKRFHIFIIFVFLSKLIKKRKHIFRTRYYQAYDLLVHQIVSKLSFIFLFFGKPVIHIHEKRKLRYVTYMTTES